MSSENYESKRVECPNCGMPYDVPVEADAWSCDCGATWEFDPRTDGGRDQSAEEITCSVTCDNCGAETFAFERDCVNCGVNRWRGNV